MSDFSKLCTELNQEMNKARKDRELNKEKRIEKVLQELSFTTIATERAKQGLGYMELDFSSYENPTIIIVNDYLKLNGFKVEKDTTRSKSFYVSWNNT